MQQQLANQVGVDGAQARHAEPDTKLVQRPHAWRAMDSAGNVYVAEFYFNTIRKGYPPPKIRNFGFIGNQFSFDHTGPSGHLVVVEASSDLVNWLPIWTNTLAGPTDFSDPQSGIYSNRFYRTHLR